MGYWQYIAKQRGLKFGGIVIVLMILFYFAGFFMPEINHLVELKYLALIIGIPVILFFTIHYFKWRKNDW